MATDIFLASMNVFELCVATIRIGCPAKKKKFQPFSPKKYTIFHPSDRKPILISAYIDKYFSNFSSSLEGRRFFGLETCNYEMM